MSLFSSLSYLLKKAASGINRIILMKTSSNVKRLLESNFSHNISLLVESESSSINSTNYDGYKHFLTGSSRFFNINETNSWFDPITENWTNLIELPTFSGPTDTFTREGSVQFPNETYNNADLLVESWWNIFDARYLRHGWGWTITLIIAYMLILVVGAIGNLMVISVVLLRPKMRSVTNMFIMNLAVADIFVIVFCVPSTLLANIFAPWILGSFMCKAVAYVQGVSVCASVYSLAAISLDRCQAIYRNYERPRGFSKSTCIITVFIIWMGATCLTIPWAVVFEVKVSEYDGLRYCVETWEIATLGDIYFLVINLGGFYTIPLLLIFVSNWIIYYCVTHRRRVPQNSASLAPIKKMHRQTRHVVLRMLGIVTLTFLISWLPLYILVIVIKFSENISQSQYNILGIVMPIAQWLGSWNSSINPILYAFLNKKFRQMFKSILPSWIPIKGAGQYQGPIRAYKLSTSAYTGKSLVRSGTKSRSDNHRINQNGQRKSPHQTDLLDGYRSYECTRPIVETIVTFISKTIPAVWISDSLESLFGTAIGGKIQAKIITEL